MAVSSEFVVIAARGTVVIGGAVASQAGLVAVGRRNNAFSIAKNFVLVAFSAVLAGGAVAGHAAGVARVASTVGTEVFTINAGSTIIWARSFAGKTRSVT